MRPGDIVKIETDSTGIFGPAWLERAAALPVYATFASTWVLIWFSGLVEVSYENRTIALLLSLLLVASVSATAAWLAFRGYLASGLPELLYAGCGLVALGSCHIISSLIIGDAQDLNHAVTVHNLGVFLAASLHLAAALHAGRPRPSRPDPSALRAAGACLGVLALTGLFWTAAQYDLSPAFYKTGEGATPVRQLVLTLSIALLSVAAALLIRQASQRGSLALRCYGLGLCLIALGLVDVSIAVPGSILSWLGRLSQGLGHVYLLAAFMIAIRTAVQKGFDVKEAAADYYIESEGHYRALVDALRAAVISLDPAGRVVLWNPQAEVISGYGYAEAAGRPLMDLIASAGGDRVVIRDLLEERPGRYLEVTLRRKDGVEFPAEVLAFAAGAGWMKWTNLIIRDITERKEAEEKLQKEASEIMLANRMLRVFLEETGDDLFDKALHIVMEGLQSEYGVFGYIDDKGDLFCPSMSKLLKQCEVADKCIHYPRAQWKGLWSRALLEKRTFYTNEPPEVPPGHVPIRRNLAAPIMFHDRVIGLLNLANKETDYTDNDRELIEGLARRVAPVLYAWLQKKLRDDERTVAVTELRKRELRLRQALQVSRSFAFEWNPATDIVTRSEECALLLGLDGDEAIRDTGENFFQRIHPDDREQFVALLRALTPENPSYITKYRLVKPDGNVVTLEETGLGFFDADKRLSGLTGISTDVTGREKAQEEIAYLATFPKFNPNPIAETDLDGHVRFCNPSAMELLPDLAQRSKDHPWLRDWSAVTGLLSEGIQNRVTREVAINGKWYYQTLHFIHESKSVRIYGVDITGLKAAEQALRDAHGRLATTLESISDGFFSLDRQFRVTFVNETGAKAIEQTRETMLGRVLWHVFPEAVGSEFQHTYQRAMGERVTATVEAFYPPLNAWFEARAYPSEDGISVFFKDITDRRRIEQTLRENQADLNWAQSVGRIGSWRLNVQRNELQWSDENHRIFGLPKGTPMSYETFLGTVHPADRDYVNSKWTAALRGEPYDIEHRIVVGNLVKWVRERAELEFDADGQLLGGFGITQDITEHKQADEALRKSEARFRLLADTGAQLLATGNPQAHINDLAGQVMAHLGCHCFFNFLVADEQPGRLQLNAWAGIPEDEARRIEWLDYGVAVCGCVARDGLRIVAEHIPTTPDVRTELVKSYGIKAYACHPLVGTNGRTLGTLSFGTRSRETFSGEDLELMKAVADQVAMALVRMQNESDLRRSADALQQANERLEEKVLIRTEELEDTVATLKNEILVRKKIQIQLHQLSRKSLEALEADRRTVARELHDSIAGSLSAIKFGLEDVAEQALRDPFYGSGQLGTLISHLADAIKETKRISANLRPLSIDDLGLLATIEWYTRQFCQRYENIQVICQIGVEEQEIPEEFKIVFYRVMQEALTNAAKHSRADTIIIRLTKEAFHFEFEVEDNGCGFDSSETFGRQDRLSGFGLKSMQERAEICGGFLNLRTRPERGTSVRVTLPFGAAASGF